MKHGIKCSHMLEQTKLGVRTMFNEKNNEIEEERQYNISKYLKKDDEDYSKKLNTQMMSLKYTLNNLVVNS